MNAKIWQLTSVLKKFKRKNLYPFLKGLRLVDNSYFKGQTEKERYQDYCRSIYFQRLKREVLNRDHNVCKKCGDKAQTAHHLHYRKHWVRTRLGDCIAVCNKCHNEIHN